MPVRQQRGTQLGQAPFLLGFFRRILGAYRTQQITREKPLTMALQEIVYASIASEPLQASELRALLTQSRLANEAIGVTGMLVYRGGTFLQLIEGEQEVIAHLYDTIAHDKRHRVVDKIWDAPLKARSFSGWSMAFVSDQTIGLTEGFALLSTQELFTHSSDATGKKLLLGLRDRLLHLH